VERGGDGEEEEQRQTVDERTDLLYCTTGHGRHPPQPGHARRYPQLQQQTHEKKSQLMLTFIMLGCQSVAH